MSTRHDLPEDPVSQTRYMTCAETNQLVRAALKAAFPGVKFSSRSSTYSGGASIHVSWTDGPTEAEVQKVTDLYTGATFDGMTDSKDYHDSMLARPDGEVETVHYGADFIFGQRSLSPEYVAQLEVHAAKAVASHADTYRYGWGLDIYYPTSVWTEFGPTHGPCNGHQVVRLLSQHIAPEPAEAAS
jgi:hypothetical protein